MKSAVMFSRASDEWSTPQEVFDELDREFRFALDAAASEDNKKCAWFFSRETNALLHEWGELKCLGAVWLNPPYSRVREFIRKARIQAERGCTVVCLVPARTDTKWWHEDVWSADHLPYPGVEIRFIKGRLKFGTSENSAPFPSVIVIFRPVSGKDGV